MSTNPEVVIVGGGLAGLSAARALVAQGVSTLLLEAAPEVGGRVATDVVDGFRIDRGFQVLLDSYPEARAALDFASLDLRPFAPGALVRRANGFGRVADPWRDPVAGVRSLMSGVFSPADAWRMLQLRSDALQRARGERTPSDVNTARALADRGFSERAMEGFFRPFFGGVFLDHQLASPADWFEFLFAMFATGRATLPANGMRAIPQQLAAALPSGTVRTAAKVDIARPGRVELHSGEQFAPRAVIIATDARHHAILAPGSRTPAWSGCVTLSYAAERSPVGEPLLVLDGERRSGPVSHVCVPSDVAPAYSPPGAHLISATVVGTPTMDDAALDRAAREQLGRWFGAPTVKGWRLLRATHVAHSLPRLAAHTDPDRAVRLGEGLYASGDHLETPSINGALRSGRRAAEALLADWSGQRSAVA